MRIRYCQILQKVNMEGQANSWLPPLIPVNDYANGETAIPRSRKELVDLFLRKLRSRRTRGQDDASPDLLILESQRPITKTEKIIESFKSLRAKPHTVESDDALLKSWLQQLVSWVSDSEETVAVVLLLCPHD